MRKKLSSIALVLFTYLSLPFPALAFGQDWGTCVKDIDGDGKGDIAQLTCLPIVLSNVVTFALIASGIVAVFFIIWAGARYVTSGGDQKRIDSARKTLTWSIIGLIIILLAFFIVNIIGYLTGTQDCINQFGFKNPGCE